MPEQVDKYIQETDKSGVVHNLLPHGSAWDIAHKVNVAGDEAAKAERARVEGLLLKEYENATPDQSVMLEVMASLRDARPHAFLSGVDEELGSIMLLRHPGRKATLEAGADELCNATLGITKDGIFLFDNFTNSDQGNPPSNLKDFSLLAKKIQSPDMSVKKLSESSASTKYEVHGTYVFSVYPQGLNLTPKGNDRVKALISAAETAGQAKDQAPAPPLVKNILDSLI